MSGLGSSCSTTAAAFPLRRAVRRRRWLSLAGGYARATIVTAIVAVASASGAERRPNILLLMTDQQQADALSAFRGMRDLHTPNLDRLAEHGVAFTRAYVANPRCTPSRSSLFSGYYPHQTGVQENDPPVARPFAFPLLGRYFSDAGYRTAYFGKFHIPVSNPSQHGFQQTAHLRSSGEDEAATQDALAFLQHRGDAPFLLVVSYCNPHNICEFGRSESLPDGPIAALPPLDACPAAVPNPELPRDECDAVVEQRALRKTLDEYRVLERYSGEDWRRYRWAYYRMIEKVDAQIGRVLDGLDQSGARQDTLIVFTSDHGECAGAHGFSEKLVFYEESVRVPLIVSWSGQTPNVQRPQLINTGIDLLPTLFDFAGMPTPETLPGRSLRPLTTSGAAPEWREYVVSATLMRAGETAVNGRMVRNARYKYCVFDRGTRRESLFDEVSDPLETVNLASDPAHVAALQRARDQLREHATRYQDDVATACLRALAPAP